MYILKDLIELLNLDLMNLFFKSNNIYNILVLKKISSLHF